MSKPEIFCPCPQCGIEKPIEVIQDGFCDWCRAEKAREQAAIEYKARLEDKTWNGPVGNHVRLQRNDLLAYWRWTVEPDSPLSLPCQEEFKTYLSTLHRLRVDYDKPDNVVWPVVPALEYRPLTAQPVQKSNNGKGKEK